MTQEALLIKNRSKAIQFRHWALRLVDAEKGYEWGKENIIGTDCSGTVCYPLMKMGFKIRTTAEGLYRHIFTTPVNNSFDDLKSVMSVFYVSSVEWTKLSGEKMPVGTVRHVTPVVGSFVVIDADWSKDAIMLKTTKAVRLKYEKYNCMAVWKAIDWAKAQEISDKENMYFDPDFKV